MGVLENNGGSQTTLGVRIALNLVCLMVFGCRMPDETQAQSAFSERRRPWRGK